MLGPVLPVPPPPPPPRPVSLFEDESRNFDFPLFTPVNSHKAYVSEEMDESYEEDAQARTMETNDKGKQREGDVEQAKQEITNLVRTFKADVDRILSRSLGMDPTDVWGITSTEGQSKRVSLPPPIESERATTPQCRPIEAAPTVEPQLPASPVIHENILCDMCHQVVIGVRHKCLDCPGLASTPSALKNP